MSSGQHFGRMARTLIGRLRSGGLKKRFITRMWKWQLALERLRWVTKPAYRRGGPTLGVDGWTVLKQLTDSETAQGLDGNLHKTTPFISPGEGQELHDTLLTVKPEYALEIGFLHGYSTLNMLQALAEIGHGKLLSIDPGQFGAYARGIGLMNVRRAGLQRFHVFWPESSQFALPRLCRLEVPIQFAFIDGNHLVDYTMLEFFYLDKLIPRGGILVFHDYMNPSVHTATKFIEANHSYSVLPCAEENLRMLVKRDEDVRPWYYFVPLQVPNIAWKTSENRPMVTGAFDFSHSSRPFCSLLVDVAEKRLDPSHERGLQPVAEQPQEIERPHSAHAVQARGTVFRKTVQVPDHVSRCDGGKSFVGDRREIRGPEAQLTAFQFIGIARTVFGKWLHVLVDNHGLARRLPGALNDLHLVEKVVGVIVLLRPVRDSDIALYISQVPGNISQGLLRVISLDDHDHFPDVVRSKSTDLAADLVGECPGGRQAQDAGRGCLPNQRLLLVERGKLALRKALECAHVLLGTRRDRNREKHCQRQRPH